MQERTAESPMDFTWENRPMDVTSPFTHVNGMKRTHSAFDTPTKNAPSLREPNNQTFFFSSVPQPRAPVFGQPGFTTPQKADVEMSSDPPSPASDDDDNQDTPEPPAREDRRTSLFNMFSRPTSSPGRGISTNRRPNTKKYSHKAGQRIEKRRNQHIMRTLGLHEDEDRKIQLKSMEALHNTPAPPASRWTAVGEFLTFIEAHPGLPDVLSYWGQFAFNSFLLLMCAWCLYAFLRTMGNEFQYATDNMVGDLQVAVIECQKNFRLNQCHLGDEVLPALRDMCQNWQRCIDKDPSKVPRANLTASTLASIFNSFLENLSWKTIFVSLATFFIFVLGGNLSFTLFRKRSHEHQNQKNMQLDPTRSQQFPHYYPNQLPYPQHPIESYPWQPKTPGQVSHGTPMWRLNATSQDQEDDSPEEGSSTPLLLEQGPSKTSFVTERSREREEKLRTPSPTKRRFA